MLSEFMPALYGLEHALATKLARLEDCHPPQMHTVYPCGNNWTGVRETRRKRSRYGRATAVVGAPQMTGRSHDWRALQFLDVIHVIRFIWVEARKGMTRG